MKVLDQTPEEMYMQAVDADYRKKLGQFFTPPLIADFMANWILGNGGCRKVLDPAIGLGVFFRSIAALTDRELDFTGFDIDPGMLDKTGECFAHLGLKADLRNGDYLIHDWENLYDGIICNPPYLKFQDYEPKDRLLQIVETRLNTKLSGFTNIYTLFLLKAVMQLSENGRAAFIVPSEFMNAGYGTFIKDLLIKSGKLRYVIVVDYNVGLFEDAMTTSSILLFANDGHGAEIEFINVADKNDFRRISESLAKYPDSDRGDMVKSVKELDPLKKWRIYYQGENSVKYKNLAPFSKYGKVSRGIATGANEYFRFTETKRAEHSINPDHLIPCITKAGQVDGSFFTREDYERLLADDKPVRLLKVYPMDTIDPALNRFIELGEREKVNERFLTKHRNPWFIMEERAPSPIWATVFNRNSLKFIRNEAGVSNLTTFHCVYIHEAYRDRLDLIMAYLLTDICNEIFQDSRREYGGGLKKFEPNDLNNALIVDIEQIGAEERDEILHVFRRYRQSEIGNQKDGELLDRLNTLFLNRVM